VGEKECSDEAESGPGDGQDQALAQDQFKDSASWRPERHPNGDLASLLVYHVGDGSIDSESREQQCGGCK